MNTCGKLFGAIFERFDTIENKNMIARKYRNHRIEELLKEQSTTHQDIHQDKILKFCKEPRTTKEIMVYLGLKDRRNFYLKSLLDSGKLQIPDKPNTKNQKYIKNKERCLWKN